jgi:hypothetical protein
LGATDRSYRGLCQLPRWNHPLIPLLCYRQILGALPFQVNSKDSEQVKNEASSILLHAQRGSATVPANRSSEAARCMKSGEAHCPSPTREMHAIIANQADASKARRVEPREMEITSCRWQIPCGDAGVGTESPKAFCSPCLESFHFTSAAMISIAFSFHNN